MSKFTRCKLLVCLRDCFDLIPIAIHKVYAMIFSSPVCLFHVHVRVHRLQQTQEAPLNEEWVRTISGLIQGIMFHQDSQSSRESCRGEEAKTLLSKTCSEICEQVQALEEDSAQETPDMNAFFAPFKYSLLDSNILSNVMPESNTNPHFSVNENSPILQMDAKLELEKAKEEHEHKQHLPTKGPAVAKTADATVPAKAVPGVPVFRPTKINSTKTPGGSSAMFMPKKPNPLLQARGGGVGAAKASLHTRKAGAAQSLLMKNRLKQQRMAGNTTVTAAATGTKVGGGARTAALQRSKMKMIDVTEVDTLNKEHAKRDDQMTKTEKLQSRKRKILDAAAKQGLVSKRKVEPASSATTKRAAAAIVPKTNANANGNANVEAPTIAVAEPPPQPPQVQAPVPPQPAAVDTHLVDAQQQQQQQQANGAAKSPQEWQVLLADRSNKLSSEDRFRVKQFFEEHYNPTPDKSVYKMKLHEERTHDHKTGAAIKETYYLELDYTSFTSKQSKKVKRY
jgi:hypothetical protein